MAERVAPDAVVLDVRLPDGNGFDVCRALKAANPDLAVLIVSTDEHHARHASDCGAVAFVPKTRLSSADLATLLRGAHETGRRPPRRRDTRPAGFEPATSRSGGARSIH